MTEAIIRERLAELNDLLETSASLKGSDGLDDIHDLGVYLSADEGSVLAEEIDVARLRIRYLMFDLEATKRENQYLRQMIAIRKPKPKPKDDKSEDLDSF
ncbi:MAG: hypothetical protein HN350_09625 [Phycisphaerales bacterium]|jgi:hypothetical protein|nr:hypothetical protein [Phycisphaerales bacterium]